MLSRWSSAKIKGDSEALTMSSCASKSPQLLLLMGQKFVGGARFSEEFGYEIRLSQYLSCLLSRGRD